LIPRSQEAFSKKVESIGQTKSEGTEIPCDKLFQGVNLSEEEKEAVKQVMLEDQSN
jgi:hypothetical protein